MTKQKFAELLLSRYMSMTSEDRFDLFESLFLAGNDLRNEFGSRDRQQLAMSSKRIEDLEEFSEWAINLSEILFSEDLELISLDEIEEHDG